MIIGLTRMWKGATVDNFNILERKKKKKKQLQSTRNPERDLNQALLEYTATALR
jgi:hypothetical protein